MKRFCLLVLLTLLIVGAVLVDRFNFYVIAIKGFDEIVSYILQIQATISTLGIALLSFITNRSDEEYFGKNVTQFAFKQSGSPLSSRNCVIIDLLLVPLSIALYCFKFYNSVVISFVVSLILIIHILNNVSIVFKPKKEVRSDLFTIVKHEVLSDERTISEFFDSFQDAILNKSIDVIDEYSDKTKTLYELLLQSNGTKNYRLFCEKLSIACDSLLKSKVLSKIEIGVHLLLEIFTMYRDSGNASSEKDPDIISQCYSGIYEAFKETEDAGIKFELCCHLPYIIFGAEITDNRKGSDVKPWFSLGKAFGFHVDKNTDLSIIKEMVMASSDLYFFSNHPYKKEVNQALTNYKTGFAISILNSGKANQSFSDYVVKTINRISLDDESILNYVLTLIIYCLYICIFETQVPIPESRKQVCQFFLNRIWEPTKEMIKNAVYTDRFSLKEYEKNFSPILRHEELFNEEEAKFMVMDHAIRESIIIIFAICIEYEQYFKPLVEDYIGNDGFSFYAFIENNETSSKTIKTVLEVLRDESYMNRKVDENSLYIPIIYLRMRETIEKAYKNGIIKHAIDLESELGDIEELNNHICQQLEIKIAEKTDGIKGKIYNEEELDFFEKNIPFNCYVTLISYQNDNYLQLFPLYTNRLIGEVFEQVGSVAKEENINPNNPEDMERFFELLGRYDTVIGSEPFIRYENLAIKEKYKKVVSAKKALFTSTYPGKMILFDSTSNFFRFKEFSVKTRRLSNDEILGSKNVVKREDNQYSVSITNDTRLSFTEEELLRYYSAHMRQIQFSCTEQYKFSNATIVQFVS